MGENAPRRQHRAPDRPDRGARPATGEPSRAARPERPALPDVTSDETAAGWGDWREDQDDDRFLREVPPHHGTY